MPFWYLYYLCYYGFWVRGFCFEVTFFTSLKSFSFNFSRHPLNMMLVRLSIAGHPPAIWSGCPNSSPAPIWVEIDTVSQSKVHFPRMQFETESLGQESNKLKASRFTRNVFSPYRDIPIEVTWTIATPSRRDHRLSPGILPGCTYSSSSPIIHLGGDRHSEDKMPFPKHNIIILARVQTRTLLGFGINMC